MAGINTESAVDLLKKGKIIGFPTDTVNGMGVLYDNFEGIERIFDLKKRDKSKPFALFFPSVEWVYMFFRKSKTLEIIADAFLPGPLTLIASPRRMLHNMLMKDSLASFRVPADKRLQELLLKAGKPIAVTSLNLSGEKIIIDEREAHKKLPEVSIFGALSKASVPSTVVRVFGGNIDFVREGAVSSRDFIRKLKNI